MLFNKVHVVSKCTICFFVYDLIQQSAKVQFAPHTLAAHFVFQTSVIIILCDRGRSCYHQRFEQIEFNRNLNLANGIHLFNFNVMTYRQTLTSKGYHLR